MSFDLSKTKVTLAKTCGAPNCDQQAVSAGYCPRHYQQTRRYGRLTPEREYAVSTAKQRYCSVSGCEELHISKGFCYRHYQQIRRHGRLTPEREHFKST